MDGGCGMRCCWRLRDRQAADVSARLHQVLLKRQHAAVEIAFRRASLDDACVLYKERALPPAGTPQTGARGVRSATSSPMSAVRRSASAGVGPTGTTAG